MYESLRFYNWFGNGDLFNSREFVKELMANIPAKEYWYHHQKSPRMFEDISDLKHARIDERCDNSLHLKHYNDTNDLYINTWIGLNPGYVLPGIGCTVAKNRDMYNAVLKAAGIEFELTKPLKEYLPTIDWEKLPTVHRENINKFVVKHRDSKLVLFCTGHVQSGQADNFDLTGPLAHICDLYPDINFVSTGDKLGIRAHNMFYAEDIIQAQDGFDLNEIGYLSKYCTHVIGRPAGPFVFAQHRENLYNSALSVLAFSYHPNVSTFAHTVPIDMKVYWSPSTEFNDVVNDIKEVLG